VCIAAVHGAARRRGTERSLYIGSGMHVVLRAETIAEAGAVAPAGAGIVQTKPSLGMHDSGMKRRQVPARRPAAPMTGRWGDGVPW
jgi:hypothetical protein